MANPQPDKHTRLANELLDQLPFYKFNGSQLSIIMVVWRNTYGWNRKDHELSLTFLHERTGLAESTVKQELRALLQAKVLLVTKQATQNSARKLSFNKDYEAWTIPKRGDPMDEENQHGGCDRAPRSNESGGCDYHPRGGCDCTPQVAIPGDAIAPPKKDILLKTSFKDNNEAFEIFWSNYPRKVSKDAALKAWTKLCKEKSYDANLVIQNTVNFSKTVELLGTQKQHIPHPSTYLNQKRYKDYSLVDPEGIAAEKQSKFGSNLDFLKYQIGGGQSGQETGGIATGEGIGRLPEQSSRFEK